jgi:alcohol dehydrogenase class IV
MLRQWDFQLPTRIHFGRGLVRKLGELAGAHGERVLLVGYRDRAGMEETYQRAAQVLTRSGLTVTTFFEVLPEPDIDQAQAALDAARRSQAAAVVGLGGGSVIDVAKAAALAESANRLQDLLAADPAPAPTDGLPIVAVPTTAGTGAEVSDVAVFSQRIADGRLRKVALFGPAMRPRAAVIDPDLAVGSPAALTAASGADALGHALEACVSRRSHPLSLLLGGQAVALIQQNLLRAVQRPDDPEPREPLALAALLAGAAFTSAGVAGPHAVAQALTSELGVPHSLAVAMATPALLRLNAEACEAQYAHLADWCRLPSGTVDTQARRFVEHIIGLLKGVGLPDRFQAASGESGLVDRLVAAATQARVPLVQNPVRLDEPALRRIFSEILG